MGVRHVTFCADRSGSLHNVHQLRRCDQVNDMNKPCLEIKVARKARVTALVTFLTNFETESSSFMIRFERMKMPSITFKNR